MVAIDNKIEQAMVSCSAAPSPRTFPRHPGCCARGWAPRSRGCARPGAGVPLPAGVPAPHPAARQSCSLSERREAHWLQPLRSAQAARLDTRGDFGVWGCPGRLPWVLGNCSPPSAAAG